MNRTRLRRREFAAAMMGSLASMEAADRGRLTFCCGPRNDLYLALSTSKRLPRYDTPSEAIRRASHGSGVLILAEQYPNAMVTIPGELMTQAREKALRVYVEYSSWQAAPGEQPRVARWERGVVASPFFGDTLPSMRILGLHDCHLVPLQAEKSTVKIHLTMAKVAGFDTAVFGLPDKKVWPLLVESNDGRVLAATTKLSSFITARYGPAPAWTHVWQAVLQWLIGSSEGPILRWQPVVRPSWGAATALPKDIERQSFARGMQWYYDSRLFIHPSWVHKLAEAKNYPDQVGPIPDRDAAIGDGSLGMLEGHSSQILPDGSQKMRWWIRADCVGETAMVLSLAHQLKTSEGHRRVATNLLDFLMVRSKMSTGSRLDPNSPSYGLIGWNETPKYHKGEDGYDVYYGDDNARSLLGTLTTMAITGESRWEERFWLAILGNFRLLGTLGHQKARYDQAPLQEKGWKHYFDSPIVLHDMNYQAYPWALFLWAYTKTGYRPFLDRVEKGIRLTMQAYPNQWRWSNSITSQQARLLLPLAWLVRVNDTKETRGWLDRLAMDLLAHQHSTGAISEWTGLRETGLQMPPASNDEYGSGEGTLIQKNGDPATDMLYTMNFAFIGLHEAFHATGEKKYRDATNRIADLLVRAQVRSEIHPEFDGAWFRAFDYKAWDYWASNSDSGWGAWCTESGWIQSWISTVFALRLMNRSLWDVNSILRRFDRFDELRRRMLPVDGE